MSIISDVVDATVGGGWKTMPAVVNADGVPTTQAYWLNVYTGQMQEFTDYDHPPPGYKSFDAKEVGTYSGAGGTQAMYQNPADGGYYSAGRLITKSDTEAAQAMSNTTAEFNLRQGQKDAAMASQQTTNQGLAVGAFGAGLGAAMGGMLPGSTPFNLSSTVASVGSPTVAATTAGGTPGLATTALDVTGEGIGASGALAQNIEGAAGQDTLATTVAGGGSTSTIAPGTLATHIDEGGSAVIDSTTGLPSVTQAPVDTGWTGVADTADPSMLSKLLNIPIGTIKSLLSTAAGAAALLAAYNTQKQTKTAAATADPFGPYRAQYATQLNELMANPRGKLTQIPGYNAGLEAVERAGASQGWAGSGNMMAALQNYGGDFFQKQLSNLAMLSGATINPLGSAQIQQSGNQAATSLYGNALNYLLYGASGLIGDGGAQPKPSGMTGASSSIPGSWGSTPLVYGQGG